jgi:hypothetical protein
MTVSRAKSFTDFLFCPRLAVTWQVTILKHGDSEIMEDRNCWQPGKFHNKKVTFIEKKRNLSNFIPSSLQIGGFSTVL